MKLVPSYKKNSRVEEMFGLILKTWNWIIWMTVNCIAWRIILQ